MICSCVVGMVAILYFFFDVNYFLRMFVTLLFAKLFQKKIKIFDETVIYGICTTQDVDLVLKHMNNARYLRELDFARFQYYFRSGIYDAIRSRGGGAVQGASSTRYRKPLSILTPYKVTTKLIYWDDKNFYLEHQFISLPDNFIRAVGLSKQTPTNLRVPVSEIIAQVEPGVRRPELSKELRLWIESMEESSQKLKKER